MKNILPAIIAVVSIGIPAYLGYQAYTLGQLRETSSFNRAEEIRDEQDTLRPTLESCFLADIPAEEASPECFALRERYQALNDELARIVITPAYEEAFAHRNDTTWTDFGVALSFGMLGLGVAAVVSLAVGDKEHKKNENPRRYNQ